MTEAASGKTWYLPHNGIYHPNKPGKIRVMFDLSAILQVKVPKDQCSFLKFLCWDNSDHEKEIIDYEMTAHVFGETSSLSCSNFTLRRTAKDNEQQYGKEITQILERSFYVDDLLKSFPTVKKAVNGIKQLQELCSRRGFNLTKFTNNKQEVIKSIPDNKRKPNVRNELVTLGNLPE